MSVAERHPIPDFLRRKGGALDDRITQFKLNRRSFFEEFRQHVVAGAAAGAGAATGTAGDINVLSTPENVFLYHIKGTQTLVAPIVTTVGLDIGMDQADNDGVELACTTLAASRLKGVFLAGSDGGFYCRAKIKVADISGTDDLCVGFRKVEAFQANVDDYDEGAWLQVGGGAAGRYNSETVLNNAATTTTNLGLTVWADGETHELEVRISPLRVATFYVDGVLAGTAPSFTFDADEILQPFIFFLHSSDLAGLVEVIEWEAGLAAEQAA
jgi:hypothetical protein